MSKNERLIQDIMFLMLVVDLLHVVDEPDIFGQLEDFLVIVVFVFKEVTPKHQFLQTGNFTHIFYLLELLQKVETQVQNLQFAQFLNPVAGTHFVRTQVQKQ
ncbi:MAG: hypothetical protein ACK56F_23075 [bacterium]